MKFLKKHDILLRLLSVALAVVIWAIVMGAVNPQKNFSYNSIPVTLTGTDALLANTGLSVIEGDGQTVRLTVKGAANTVTTLRKGQLSIQLDVSSLTEAGEYELPITSNNVSISRAGIEFQSARPGAIKVRVDELETKTVPVRAAISGAPAAEYSAGKPEPTTKNIVVEGPAADVEEVAYAYVTIAADGATGTIRQDCPVTLCNEAGDPIASSYVTTKTQTITVTLPVYRLGTLPLTVTLKDGGTVTADQATVTISPSEVQLIGDQNAIAQMTEINLGEIDLGSVKTDTAIIKTIDLPAGVRLVEGQPSSAEVTVTIDGVDTRHVSVTQFVVTDTADEQQAQRVLVTTQSVEIELRGAKSALDLVDEDSFSIGLTLDSASLGEGVHAVKGMVTATGLPAGVTLVGEDVQVDILIDTADETPAGVQRTGLSAGLLPEPDGSPEAEGGDGA